MVKLFWLNQENAAYPSGLCAERVAISWCHLSNSKILKMAITAASDTNQTTTPIPPVVLADNLLQSMKSSRKHLLIYFMGEIGNIYKSDSIKNLLPFMFDKILVKSPKSPLYFSSYLNILFFATRRFGANLWRKLFCVIGTN
jgi:cytidine deaminase